MTTCTTPPRSLDWRPAPAQEPCQSINYYRQTREPCAAPPWKQRTLAVMESECRYAKGGGYGQPKCNATPRYTIKPAHALLIAMQRVALPHRIATP